MSSNLTHSTNTDLKHFRSLNNARHFVTDLSRAGHSPWGQIVPILAKTKHSVLGLSEASSAY